MKLGEGRSQDVVAGRVASAYIHALRFRETNGRWPYGIELGEALGCATSTALRFIRHLAAAGMMPAPAKVGGNRSEDFGKLTNAEVDRLQAENARLLAALTTDMTRDCPACKVPPGEAHKPGCTR